MAELLDSGARREFENGAVRDVAEGKGRCDLLPLEVVGELTGDTIFFSINSYIWSGNIYHILCAIKEFSIKVFENIPSALLEVAKQYEDGARKYADRNWEKGIPVHVFIDSGVRHYLKYLRGDTDEPHDRAFIWNMLGAIWTHENKPELIDLPFADIAIPITESKTPYNTYLEEMGEEDVSEPFDSERNVCGVTSVALGEPVKGKYDVLDNYALKHLICVATPSCSKKCPLFVPSGGYDTESCTCFPEFRKIAIDWLNKQDGLEGKA